MSPRDSSRHPFRGRAPGSPRLRSLGEPRPVEVRTDPRGIPQHVRLPGRPARRVEAVRERWRIDDEWWRTPIVREYHAVVLDDGRFLTLYRDLEDGRWYVQTED